MGFEYETDFLEYVSNQDSLASDLGLEDLPSRSTFWKAWNKHLPTDEDRVSLRIIVNAFIKIARQYNVQAPSAAFQPKFNTKKLSDPDADSPSIREYAETKTEEIWKEIRPFVHHNYRIHRGSRTSIEQASWWEGHAYIAPREDEYAESGLDNFAAESNREKV